MGMTVSGHTSLSLLMHKLSLRIAFDHSYWEVGGNNSKYNYAARAVAAGHSIFYYDRLGKTIFARVRSAKLTLVSNRNWQFLET